MINSCSTQPRLQFSLRFLILGSVAVAGSVLVLKALDDHYYWQLNHVKTALKTSGSLTNIQIDGNEDTFYEVEKVAFAISKEPGSWVEILVDHGGHVAECDHLFLSQLGPWRFVVSGYGQVGPFDSSGKRTWTEFSRSWIDVGTAGPFATSLPCGIRGIKDLVYHYQTLERHFESWPTREAPGSVEDANGRVLNYYVEYRPR